MAQTLTHHARRRAQQRAIPFDAVECAQAYGTPIHQNGATVYFLGRRHVPAGTAPAAHKRLAGTLVVISDGVVVTSYRCRKPARALRKRPHPWRPRSAHPHSRGGQA